MARTAELLDRRPDLRRLAWDQAGAVSRGQLRSLGLDHDAVARQLRARRWQAAGPGVVVVFTGPLPTGTTRWAALLSAGESALASWTALQVRGLTGWERDAVHVVVDRGSRPPPLAGVVVHESRRHLGSCVTAVNGMPCHSVERAAVDAVAWSRQPRTAMGLLAAVVQQGLSTPDRIADVLAEQGRIRHRRLAVATLQDISGGARALSEIDFVRLCEQAALPRPRLQAVRTDSSGRRRYLDVEWRTSSGLVRAVEIDGMGHLDSLQWYDDLLRAADLTCADGSRLLRLPAAAVRRESGRVVDILRRYLALP